MTQRVLLCTTNGTGLGHVSRAMAIARRLDAGVTPVIFTLSQAAPIVRSQGFALEFLPSAGYADLDRGDWNLLYERRLGELLSDYDPAVVAFDGTYPYLGLLTQMPRHPHRRFVWVRRGMWLPGLGADSAARASLFDAVIEPGDLVEADDRGATVAQRREVTRVAPILQVEPEEIHDRAVARARLGLEPDDTWVLVQLGSGALNDASSLVAQAVTALQAIGGLRIAVAESTLVARRADLPVGVRSLRRYPLAPDLAAFDFAVTAAGYNSVHELAAAAVPTVFFPNVDSLLDDQATRAEGLARRGAAGIWRDGTAEGLRVALEPFTDPESRAAIGRRSRALLRAGGARQAAVALTAGAA